MNRRLATRAGAALAGVALAGALVACTPPENTAAAAAVSLGVIGNSKDAVHPYTKQNSPSSNALWKQLYDGLTTLGADGSVEMALAESMTPNGENTVWTVRLRPGVLLHNGLTFGADDVI